VVATVFALSVPSIVDALLYSYTFWAPTIVIPLLAAVLLGTRAKAAALSAIVAGAVVTAGWIVFLQERTGLDGLVVGAAANVVVFAVVALATRATPPTTPARRPVAEEA
jgi:SSS family solute:Na+ symporter